MKVHPLYDIDALVWATDTGVTAPSLRELQRKLPRVEIVGYYPQGFAAVRAKHKPGDQVRSLMRTNYAGGPVFPQRPTPAPPAAPKVDKREERRLEKQRQEYEEVQRKAADPYRARLTRVTEPTPGRGKHGRNHSVWDNYDARLEKLAKDGLSAGQIAASLGGGFTRNAVIGRCSRLNIKLARHRGNPYAADPA